MRCSFTFPAKKKTLLHLMRNRGWQTATIPALWRKAKIAAVKKKGKPADTLNLYHPISLFSCVSKLLDRIFQTRFQHRMESNELVK